MAWSGPASTGFIESNNSTSGATLLLGSFGSTIAGQISLLAIATDNISTTDGETNDHTDISTAAGAWTKLGEFTNGQGSANAGACISVWIWIGEGTHTGASHTASASIGKRAWVQGTFSFTGSGITAIGTTQTLPNDGSDPGSMTLGSLSNAEHLWFRAIASESNSTVKLTPTTNWIHNDWGAGTSPVTSGGGSASNIGCRIEYRITTATTATSDPTLFSADHASIMIALDEILAIPGAARRSKRLSRFLTFR